MTAPRTTVSIVIPTYNGMATLPAVLRAIRAQDGPPVEIMAVDSGSTDGTLDALMAYGARIHEIPNRDFTHGGARNLGANLATGDTLIFMSQDARPARRDWLIRFLESLSVPNIGGAYCRQVPREGATPLEAYFQGYMYPPQSKVYAPLADPNAPLARSFFSNACSLIPRRVWEAHPFRTDLIMSEDQAFSRAALWAGYAIHYNAAAIVIHSHGYGPMALFRRNFDSAYSLRGLARETVGGLAGRGIGFVAGEIAFLVRGGHWRWLLRLPVYEAARAMGRIAGRHAERFPLRLRRALSMHRRWWG